jgi:hypothetical protein
VIEVLQRPDPVSTALARQRARRYDWSTVGAAVQRVYRTALAGARQAPLAASRPIMLTALPPPTGNLYAQPASMSSIAARTAPPAPSAQRAGKT